MRKKTKVQISLYASSLKNIAGFGKGTSDPYAVITLLAGSADVRPRILGRTEVVKNNLSPSWTHTFITDYSFGEETRVNVGIFDEVRKGHNKSMGSAQFEVGEVLGAKGNIRAKALKNGGTLFMRVHKASDLDLGTLNLSMRGMKLKNVDGLFGKSDPFFTVEAYTQGNQQYEGRSWLPVYKSETVKNNLNPVWKECQIPIEKLCNGNKELPIQISVYDWEKSGKHQSMGKFQSSTNAILTAGTKQTSFDLVQKGKSYGKVIILKSDITGQELDPTRPPPKFATVAGIRRLNPDYKKWQAQFGGTKQQSPSHRTPQVIPPPHFTHLNPVIPAPGGLAPTLEVDDRIPKFVDYISGGTEINMVVAIDYTGSNGDPRTPGTLHYIHKDGQLNDYEKALTSVGAVIARYDADKRFQAYGFGAKFEGDVNHCFQIGEDPELDGLKGILKAYRQIFASGLTMSGPTVITDVIQEVAMMAESRQEANKSAGKQAYTVLLILTDGAVADVKETKQAIRYAGSAPLSIVIVGVGDDDFSAMQFLDDFHRNEPDVRDIVQFVEFNRHRYNKESLTKETLDEIPDQLVHYFYSNGIMPLPPVQDSRLSIHAEDFNEYRDLELEINECSRGDLTLVNPSLATFDARSFAQAADILKPSAAPLRPISAPSYSNQGSSYGHLPPPMVPPSFSDQPSFSRQSSRNNSNQGGQGGGYNVPVLNSSQRISLRVRAPANTYPGMRIQVQHPNTGQYHLVIIPNGVPSGGDFQVDL